ncbi:MAG TPA: hypothetical protein DEB39_09655 [Planctomycetaceae bacterium]|nr:hypothetical protein [Planctomycetaceae bacterium]
MCHYITGFLAGSFDLKEARMLAERFSIVLDPIENRSVAKLLAPDEVYFNMTKGMCACGTDLCNQKNAAQWIESEFRRLDRDEKKHRKKGWSDAKIERWRSQQNEMIHRRFGDEPLEIHPGPDCIRFSEFFNTLFEETLQ